jgi:GxxExxY protein
MTNESAGIDALTEKVIGCAIEVHRAMGPGLLERIYHECLLLELLSANLEVQSGESVPIEYKGTRLAHPLQIDLLVERLVVVEIKAVERFHPVHLAQLMTYLKLTGCPAGLLFNFREATLRAGLRRAYHPDRYPERLSGVARPSNSGESVPS